MKKTLIIIFLLLSFTLLTLNCEENQPNTKHSCLIFDFVTSPDKPPTVYYLFDITEKELQKYKIRRTATDKNNKTHFKVNEENLNIFKIDKDKYTDDKYKRMFLHKGDILHIYAIVGENLGIVNVKFSIAEEGRRSKIFSDILELISLASRIGEFTTQGIHQEIPKPEYLLFYESHRIENTRSKISISVQPITPKVDKSKTKDDVIIITGKREHLFLTADLLVFKLNEVKWLNDKDKMSLMPKDTPKEFYIGINYNFRDVYIEKMPKIKLYLKGLMKFSKSPFESFGLGIGLSLHKFLGISFSDFSIFGAHVWTRDENELNDTITKRYKSQFLLGVSYELGTAAKWLKSDSKK